MVRGRLLELWREARKTLDPVDAWASIVEDPKRRRALQERARARRLRALRLGRGERNRSPPPTLYTIKKYGPDRIVGFSPIPAMSMVSYAAGARYLSLIGGVCM